RNIGFSKQSSAEESTFPLSTFFNDGHSEHIETIIVFSYILTDCFKESLDRNFMNTLAFHFI
ncbi:MAG TPA: hypothetical protein ACFYEH_01730, partial [Candidatus Brocadiaceae bacterium]